MREFITKSVPSAATSLVEEAKSRLIEDDVPGALELLEQALAIDPDDEDAALTRMEALLACGSAAEAEAVARSSARPSANATRPVRDALRLATLKARAQLALGGSGDLDALAKRAAASPDDPQAKTRLRECARGAAATTSARCDELLTIVDSDRAYGDEAARRAMLTIFEALGADSDLARHYRRELASAINR